MVKFQSMMPLRAMSRSMAVSQRQRLGLLPLAYIKIRDHGGIPGLGSHLGSHGCPRTMQNCPFSSLAAAHREAGLVPHPGCLVELALVARAQVSCSKDIGVGGLTWHLSAIRLHQHGDDILLLAPCHLWQLREPPHLTFRSQQSWSEVMRAGKLTLTPASGSTG